jgi:hypothetical protein
LSRKVSGPGINGKLAVSLGVRLNFDGVITVNRGSGGVVCDGVLVANIAGNFGGDRIDILQRAGEKSDSSCLAREGSQVTPGMPSFATAKHQSDGVDDGALHVLHAMNRVIQRELRSVVIAIGNQDQHLPGALGGSLYLVGGGYDSVVECSTTGQAQMCKPVL